MIIKISTRQRSADEILALEKSGDLYTEAERKEIEKMLQKAVKKVVKEYHGAVVNSKKTVLEQAVVAYLDHMVASLSDLPEVQEFWNWFQKDIEVGKEKEKHGEMDQYVIALFVAKGCQKRKIQEITNEMKAAGIKINYKQVRSIVKRYDRERDNLVDTSNYGSISTQVCSDMRSQISDATFGVTFGPFGSDE